MMHKTNHIEANMKFLMPKLLKSPLSCFTEGKSSEEDEEDDVLREKLNVNEEYKEVFRTKSYVEIWSKAHQVQLEGSSPPFSRSSNNNGNNTPSILSNSPRPFYMHLSDGLLEPRQDEVINLIKSSKLQSLLKDYFDVTLEAYNVCESLLEGIHKTRSNHRIMKRVISLSSDNNCSKNEQCYELLVQDLSNYARQSNPLSTIIGGATNFHRIHDNHARLLRQLNSKRRRINRIKRLTRLYKKAAGFGILITYTALAVALVALALHTVVGLLGVPGLLLPFSTGVIKKVNGEKGHKTSRLERLRAQLDITAKGAYILVNDFDTMGTLATRLNDEVEHRRWVAEMCLKNERSHEMVKEALRELNSREGGFVEKLQELEQHIYLCFLTINRSRRLVAQEILSS